MNEIVGAKGAFTGCPTGLTEVEENSYEDLCKENQKLKEEIKELKKQIIEMNKPQIFIDTQDMEERYAEGLYQDYLEKENKKYKEVIDKISKIIYEIDESTKATGGYPSNYIDELLDILKEV